MKLHLLHVDEVTAVTVERDGDASTLNLSIIGWSVMCRFSEQKMINGRLKVSTNVGWSARSSYKSYWI